MHPSGRRRVHRTTSTSTDSRRADSEDEELLSLESTDINKRFTTSYLHVHGKLFTKVGYVFYFLRFFKQFQFVK